MRIAVSIDNNKEIKFIPVVPPDIEITYNHDTEERDSVKYGAILAVKKEGLAEVSYSSIFPAHKYSSLAPGSTADGWSYVRWFRDKRKKRKLMRVVITSNNGKERFNRLCFCTDFSVTGIDTNGDIRYSIAFKQYRR